AAAARGLGELRDHVHSSLQSLAAHINECARQMRADCAAHEQRVAQALADLREELAGPGPSFNLAVCDGVDGQGAPTVRVSARILENVFVQSRLPAPPGRILDLGAAQGAGALDLVSLGFQVAGVERRLDLETDLLPFPDDSFDAVVALSAVGPVGPKAVAEAA